MQRAEGTYRGDVEAPDVVADPPWTVFWYGGAGIGDLGTRQRVEAALGFARSFFSV